MERFELSRAVRPLPHFECGPFNHLGTSPKTGLLYQHQRKKSSFFPFLFGNFKNLREFFHYCGVILPLMRAQTTGTILDPVFRIGKAASATVTQRIQRTIAEQAAKGVPVCAFVAGKIFTLPILEKFIMLHFFTPLSTDKFPAADERIPSFLPFSDV